MVSPHRSLSLRLILSVRLSASGRAYDGPRYVTLLAHSAFTFDIQGPERKNRECDDFRDPGTKMYLLLDRQRNLMSGSGQVRSGQVRSGQVRS